MASGDEFRRQVVATDQRDDVRLQRAQAGGLGADPRRFGMVAAGAERQRNQI